MSQLSENIKYLREKAGTTQKDYGKAFGVSRDNIASYERGTSPKLDFLQKLVNFYHISMEDLVNSDLSGVCESPEKLDLKTRPKLDLNLDLNQTNPTALANQVAESQVPFQISSNFNSSVYKIQLERIESLSAENAILKKENTDLLSINEELKAENANLKDILKKCEEDCLKPKSKAS